MIQRREILIGGAGVAAAALGVGLKPTRRVSLLGKSSIEKVIPKAFPGWPSDAAQGFVQPARQGLSASLYDQVVERVYTSPTDGSIMLLAAYGGTQSDLLQLHRPEVCYPALGFVVKSKTTTSIELPGGTKLGVVNIVAVSGDRHENIVYWTRLGEFFPADGREQRMIVLQDAIAGFIPDGILVRCSTIDTDSERAFQRLHRFIPTFLEAVTPAGRPALIGTKASAAMQVA